MEVEPALETIKKGCVCFSVKKWYMYYFKNAASSQAL